MPLKILNKAPFFGSGASMTKLWIPGEPVGKGRPRAARTGHVYTPARTRAWETEAACVARATWGRTPLACPVVVTIDARWSRPRRRPSSVSADQWATPGCPRPSTPDADNVAKAVLDALQKGGVLADDRYVVGLTVRTLYADLGAPAGIQVVIAQWEGI